MKRLISGDEIGFASIYDLFDRRLSGRDKIGLMVWTFATLKIQTPSSTRCSLARQSLANRGGAR